MKCLVTGGSGFLGSHLVEALVERGERVCVLVRPTSKTDHLAKLGVELCPGDLGDMDALNKAARDVDFVYHCAALAADWGRWQDFERTNVVGTRNLLQAALESGVDKFIHIRRISEWLDNRSAVNFLDIFYHHVVHIKRSDRLDIQRRLNLLSLF